jgi:hypothetical protein
VSKKKALKHTEDVEQVNMGGPCKLQSGAVAPACTDNFQVMPFTFEGKEWQSWSSAIKLARLHAQNASPHVTTA